MEIKALNKIKNDQGILQLKNLGADIYIVGGCVRDHFLGKKSKDIDIIVRLLDDKTIIFILSQFGRVDKVGESFGVIKYTPEGWIGEPIDVAQPRIDVLEDKTKGHKGIKAKFDPFITIEEDLERRDFTINSIAISWNGNIIDPFNGLKDLKNGIIRATSAKAFSEDPLRMMRAIQFHSRFKFAISEETWKMILDNKSDIKTISGERILEELDKIFFKGDITSGLLAFKNSGLHGELFTTLMLCSIETRINTREDFYFTICQTAENFKRVLKGGAKTTNGIKEKTTSGIKAIQKCWELTQKPSNKSEIRSKLFDAIQISDNILDCKKLPYFYKEVITEFKEGRLPKSTKELALNGDDFKELGFVDAEIGKRQRFLLQEIFADRISNTREDLIK